MEVRVAPAVLARSSHFQCYNTSWQGDAVLPFTAWNDTCATVLLETERREPAPP